MLEPIRILVTGDLHIGRISTRCGAAEGLDLSVRGAWKRIVQAVRRHQVQAVAITGDLVDSDKALYEALGALESGLQELNGGNIPVVLVAGNHDAELLFRLKRSFPDLHVLGSDQQWTHWDLLLDDGRSVRFLGWSHPAKPGRYQPLQSFPALTSRHADFNVALLHADYQSGSGDYAVAPLNELQRHSKLDLWLLGHLHTPEWIPGRPAVLNPGSPQALDPGECGEHSAWLVSLGESITCEPVAESTVLYEVIEIDLSDAEDTLEVVLRRKLPADFSRRRSWRVRLKGRVKALEEWRRDAQRLIETPPWLDSHNVFFDEIDVSQLGLNLDLYELAQRKDPVGRLAELLLAFDAQQAETHPLYEAIAEQVRSKREEAHSTLIKYKEACPQIPDIPIEQELIRMAAADLLDILLRQETDRR